MGRKSKTPQQRAADVIAAAGLLPDALTDAQQAAEQHGHDSREARAAWERVELLGATIHRQSRILAGKSRGG